MRVENHNELSVVDTHACEEGVHAEVSDSLGLGVLGRKGIAQDLAPVDDSHMRLVSHEEQVLHPSYLVSESAAVLSPEG